MVVRLVLPPLHRHLEPVFQKASEEALAGIASKISDNTCLNFAFAPMLFINSEHL